MCIYILIVCVSYSLRPAVAAHNLRRRLLNVGMSNEMMVSLSKEVKNLKRCSKLPQLSSPDQACSSRFNLYLSELSTGSRCHLEAL